MVRPVIDTWEEWIGRRLRSPSTKALWHMLDQDTPGKIIDDSGNGAHLDITGTGYTLTGNGITLGTQGAVLDFKEKFSWSNPFGITGDWAVSTAKAQTGTSSLKSAPMTAVQTPAGPMRYSRASLTVTVPAGSTGEFRLWYNVATELNYDFFRIFLNGVENLKTSGTVAWTQRTITLPEGTHTIMFEYARDSAGGTDADAVHVDNLEFYINGALNKNDDFEGTLVGAESPLVNSVTTGNPTTSKNGFFVGGFFKPTAADLSATWAILATTRSGGGKPIWHIALSGGKPHVRLYSSTGAEIFNYTWTSYSGLPLVAGKMYYIGLAVAIGGSGATVYLIMNGVRSPGLYNGATLPNTSSHNQISLGHMDNANKFQGFLSEWFIEKEYPAEGLGDLGGTGMVQIMSNMLNMIEAISVDEIDFMTDPGILQLAKNDDGTYVSQGTYTSNVVNLENPFPELGKLLVGGSVPYGLTDVIAETQTSADGINFSGWQYIDSEGRIQSPNYQYIKVRLTLKSNDNGFSTPQISTLSFEDYSPDAVINQVKVIPTVYDNNGKTIAYLNNLSSLVLSDATNGDETLEFSMVVSDKARELVNEYRVDIPGNRFYIRRITDDDGDGKTIRTFYCEASWYDLAVKPVLKDFSFPKSYPDAPMKKALAGTGWTIGKIDSGFPIRDMVVEGKNNPLKLLRGIQEVWGGDLVFDNVNKTVSLYNTNIDTGFAIRKRKNMKRIKRIIDTTGLITKLYPYGANDMNIGTANGGVQFVENYSWFTSRGLNPIVRETEWKDERFYNAYYLKEKAQEKVDVTSQPVVSYEVEIQDISALPRFSFEIPVLRSQVLVEDEDLLEAMEKFKIVSRELDLLRPWQSKVELSSRIKELGDEGAAIASGTDGRLDSEDAVGKTEMSELMIFNYLVNSRADNGFSGWLQNGNVNIDNANGVSWKNSFKLIGSATGKQELMQTIYPSTRENYTLSAQIATESLSKKSGAKVGIKVVIHYDDDSAPEETWLEL